MTGDMSNLSVLARHLGHRGRAMPRRSLGPYPSHRIFRSGAQEV